LGKEGLGWYIDASSGMVGLLQSNEPKRYITFCVNPYYPVPSSIPHRPKKKKRAFTRRRSLKQIHNIWECKCKKVTHVLILKICQDWWLHWTGKERKSEGDMHGKTKQN
jgi:hypothetical protein